MKPPKTTSPLQKMPSARAARFWLAVLFLAMTLEALALVVFTPATFMIFALLAVPLGLAAAGFFGVRALRALARTGVM